jgi:TetR/AcrR family transcriptional regulator, cholesterol catabolism regulator
MEPATARRATSVPAAAKRPRGRPRKTVDERDDGNRRGALILGAARLFRRKGFDATSTRDIAAAAGMQSGSPFYHFKSKQALLFAVMQEGMRNAVERQRQASAAAGLPALAPAAQLRLLVRNHFEVLLGPGSDYIPVMLYEARSITARQRAALAQLRSEYEGAWDPVLRALHASGRLRTDVKLARLMIFGALNWSVQWYDRRKEATLDDLTQAALALFIGESP